MKYIYPETQKPQRLSNRISKNKSTPKHTLLKLLNTKDKVKTLKATRQKKEITFQEVKVNTHH